MKLTIHTASYRLTKPPKAVRQAQLDNVALVPVSLLFHKPKYKAIAKNLPTGSVLICTPPFQKQRQALEKVASYFRNHGHQVTISYQDLFGNKLVNIFDYAPYHHHLRMLVSMPSSPKIALDLKELNDQKK